MSKQAEITFEVSTGEYYVINELAGRFGVGVNAYATHLLAVGMNAEISRVLGARVDAVTPDGRKRIILPPIQERRF